ncbi:hypothetical protein ACRS5S_17360 [Nocardia asiatica]
MFSHPAEAAEVDAPDLGAVRLPVFSDVVTAAPSAAIDEAGSVESGGD